MLFMAKMLGCGPCPENSVAPCQSSHETFYGMLIRIRLTFGKGAVLLFSVFSCLGRWMTCIF